MAMKNSKNKFSNMRQRKSRNKYLDMFEKSMKFRKKNKSKRNKNYSRNGVNNSSLNSSGNLRSTSRSGILNLSLKPSKLDSVQKLKLQTLNNFLTQGPQSTTFRGRKIDRFCSRTERDSFGLNNFLTAQSSKIVDKLKEEDEKEKSRLEDFFEKWTDREKQNYLIKRHGVKEKSGKRRSGVKDLRRSHSSSELISQRTKA